MFCIISIVQTKDLKETNISFTIYGNLSILNETKFSLWNRGLYEYLVYDKGKCLISNNVEKHVDVRKVYKCCCVLIFVTSKYSLKYQ